MLKDLLAAIQNKADAEKARFLLRFFKTGPGQYGEKDRFHGITVPVQRQIAKGFTSLSEADIQKLLKSPFHEERLISLFILIAQFKKANDDRKKKLYELYIENRAYVNNWDLVDTTAPHVVGKYLENKSRAILYKLAKSKSLWDRRIAILATQHFIRQGDFEDTLAIAKILLKDKEDLMHKAVGWMLREVGNRDLKIQERFLKQHYKQMPRTMLRYAIEKFPEKKRLAYLKGLV